MDTSTPKRIAALLAALALTLGLAACGGNEADASNTAAPAFTMEMPGENPGGTDGDEPEPEPEPEPLERTFLTGQQRGEDYVPNRRITAIMLNNQPNARPQNGIGDASILVEVKVEYGVTRFMAIYDDYEKIPEKVGGLRSARDQLYQLILPYWAFFAHEGPSHPSHPVNVMIDAYGYQDFDIQAKYYPIYQHDSSRSTEQYNWYDVSGASITKAIAERELDPVKDYGNSSIFDFVPWDQPPRVPEDGDAASVAVMHNQSYISQFDYDAGTGRYAMSQFNSGGGGVYATVDNLTGQQLAFENLVVLFAPVDTYPNTAPENLPKFNYADGGAGYYFSQGRYELLLWRKGSPQDPVMLYKWNHEGEMVKVNPGKTYLAVIDDELLPDFDAVLKSGTAGDAAAAGEVNANAQDTAD